MPAQKANRYTRPNPIPMRLTPRDQDIIVRCFEDKLLSSTDLLQIFFSTRQRCNRRLRKLYSQQYLDRHYLSLPQPYCGAQDALYSLGKRAVDVVALQAGIQREQIQRARQKFRRQLKSYSVLFTFAHIQAVAATRIAFEKAFANYQGAQLINWIPERLLEQRFTYNDKRIKLRPDGFMQYELKETGKVYNAFTEIDMSSQSSKQIQDKVRRYLAFSQTPLPQEVFGAPWFRVIFITKSERRSFEIKGAIECLTDKIFWMITLGELQGDCLDKPIFFKAGLPRSHPLI